MHPEEKTHPPDASVRSLCCLSAAFLRMYLFKYYRILKVLQDPQSENCQDNNAEDDPVYAE